MGTDGLDDLAVVEDARMQKMIVRRALAATGAGAVLSLGLLAGQVAAGTPAAQADPARHAVCGSKYYENSDGVCVPRPDGTPSGIRCKDGTYSHAKTRQGACSSHGGIDESASGEGGGGSALLGSAALGVIGSATLGSSIIPALIFGGS